MRRPKAGAINLSNQNPQSHVPNGHRRKGTQAVALAHLNFRFFPAEIAGPATARLTYIYL
jgi:hypothetical protein